MKALNCDKKYIRGTKHLVFGLFLAIYFGLGVVFAAEATVRDSVFLKSTSEKSYRADFKDSKDTTDSHLSVFHMTLNYRLDPGVRRATFQETFDHFNHSNPNANWYALKLDAETVQSWQEQPNFLDLFYVYQNGPWILHAQGGLGRDVEAWYQDELGSNFTTNINELNINSTPTIFAQYQDEHFEFKIGQYHPKFGPSPERGVVINSTLLHKALQSKLNLGPASFTWFWSSLDPTLSTAEKALQSQSLVSNSRGATYTEELKNLYMHRLDYHIEEFNLKLGLMESMIIGGKQASAWEVQPFTVYHNNYPDGYGNTLLSLDFEWQFHQHSTIYGEFGIDDLTGGNAENENNSSNITAWVLGYHYERDYRGGKLSTRMEVVQVDPIYGNRDLPLLQFTSRQVLRSNYREIGDETFADTYVVDQPIGYSRGPDVLDYWWEVSYTRPTWGANYELGYLQKGAYDFDTAYEQATNNPDGPVGPIQEELRHTLSGYYILPWSYTLEATLESGILVEQDLKDENHLAGFIGLSLQFF